ncbi:MAG: CHAT domain-containing protein [Bacteroidota bacterium]
MKSIYTIQSKNLYDLQTAFSTDSLSIALIDLINQENAEHETRKFLRTQVDTIYQNALETAHHLNKITKENDYNHHAFRIAEKSKAAILLSQLNDGEAKHFAGIPDSLLEKETSLKAGIGAYNKQLYDTQKDTAVVRLKINQTTDSTELARLEQQFQNGIDKINLSRDYVFDMKRELEQLIDTLENQYTEYHELKYKTNVVTVEELQQEVLTEEELLLEYMVGDTSVFVFAIAKDDFQIHEIPKPQQLEQWIDTLRMAMTDPELVRQQERQTKKWFVPAAHRLYQLLLEQPLNAVGPKVKRLVIVPGGRLHHLNFGVLLRERPAEGKRFRFKDLAYLCKDYAVSYQFSATLWHRSFQQQREANEQLLTFGGFGAAYQGTKGTDLTTRGFDGVINLPSQLDSLLFDAEAKMREVDLPFGRKEVQAADSLFRPESHIFLGAEATEQKFRETAHRYRVLHLSAHGLLDDQDPAYSKLLFTLNPDTSAADDDNLHVAEIYNLSLNADLTVLSACESGYYSDIQKGEGIMSLARAFAYAGCPALLMSQWSVNDRATASLMVSFYANLKKGLRKDVALQRAQMACLSDPSFLGKKWDHPYYWSGFVLSGDGRAMF